ncbi:hypothetical protein [Stenomitos frigidus]|uniref:Uncharacterized protein n=1 Tax=Stenomitos frigidus ULC18 TaxID=2107698 RepID=A0A2T1ECF1_9CYAN|nr:hypothetical protein [Stenomitos frigidus]PSB30432.1 hypothetical protein C7B82_09025 [Stenomitos frigidus ULC18]
MSSFVNFLKNLFSGLFSFIGGLFSSKKKQAAIADSAPKPRKSSKSGYFLELDEAKGVGTTPAPTKSVAAAPAKASESTNGATAKPAPKPVAANAGLNLPQPTVTTFAPKYLAQAGSSNGRRRPGANMSSFLDLARQVKTPS